MYCIIINIEMEALEQEGVVNRCYRDRVSLQDRIKFVHEKQLQ